MDMLVLSYLEYIQVNIINKLKGSWKQEYVFQWSDLVYYILGIIIFVKL